MREDMKEKSKKILKSIAMKLIPIILIPIIVSTILAAVMYYLFLDEATYKDNDMSSTPYAVSKYIEGVTIDKDGTIKNNTTVEDLWNEMIKKGSRVDKYLSNYKELSRLMKAELATQYPDTRKNPDKDINWKSIFKDADEIQGIVKLKRTDSDNNTSTMTYVDPATFQGYIDEYNGNRYDVSEYGLHPAFYPETLSGVCLSRKAVPAPAEFVAAEQGENEGAERQNVVRDEEIPEIEPCGALRKGLKMENAVTKRGGDCKRKYTDSADDAALGTAPAGGLAHHCKYIFANGQNGGQRSEHHEQEKQRAPPAAAGHVVENGRHRVEQKTRPGVYLKPVGVAGGEHDKSSDDCDKGVKDYDVH